MEFRKKYIFMIPASLMLFITVIMGFSDIGDNLIHDFLAITFPFILVVAFWIIEYYKFDEVNDNTKSSRIQKRELGFESSIMPFFIVLIMYLTVPSIGITLDYTFDTGELFLYSSVMFILLPACIYISYKHFEIDIDTVKCNIFRYISYVLLFTSAIFIAEIFLSITAELFDLQMYGANEESIRSSIESLPGFTKFVFILYVIIGAPIIEELIFRALPLNVNASKYLTIVLVLGTSFGFAFMHYASSFDPELAKFTDPLSVLLPYFTISIVLGISYIRSDYNLLIPISVHMTNNLLALLLY